jgi:hypothetical protein
MNIHYSHRTAGLRKAKHNRVSVLCMTEAMKVILVSMQSLSPSMSVCQKAHVLLSPSKAIYKQTPWPLVRK